MRYVSERGKIVPWRITAVSAKKQRELAQASSARGSLVSRPTLFAKGLSTFSTRLWRIPVAGRHFHNVRFRPVVRCEIRLVVGAKTPNRSHSSGTAETAITFVLPAGAARFGSSVRGDHLAAPLSASLSSLSGVAAADCYGARKGSIAGTVGAIAAAAGVAAFVSPMASALPSRSPCRLVARLSALLDAPVVNAGTAMARQWSRRPWNGIRSSASCLDRGDGHPGHDRRAARRLAPTSSLHGRLVSRPPLILGPRDATSTGDAERWVDAEVIIASAAAAILSMIDTEPDLALAIYYRNRRGRLRVGPTATI